MVALGKQQRSQSIGVRLTVFKAVTGGNAVAVANKNAIGAAG